MEEIRTLRDGGRSLDITAAKRNPTKKNEPIVTKKQPHNCEEELEEEEVEGDLIFIDDGAWNLLFSYLHRWEFGWVHQLSPAHYALKDLLGIWN